MGAANRDPRQYEDPDVFRADRNPVGHLAFGSGIHLCPGTQLARMEGQAILREIVANIDRIEVVEPPTWTTNANLRGLTRLRVAVTPASHHEGSPFVVSTFPVARVGRTAVGRLQLLGLDAAFDP